MPNLRQRQAVFLLNPNAGARRAGLVRALAPGLLAPAGISARFVEPGDRSKIVPAVKAALRSGAWAVVAVGGDGTVHPIAGALAASPCRLGILPLGTGNGFARALKIPLDAEKALGVIAAGHERRVDLGSVGAHSFANVLGLGYDAWVAVAADELRWVNRFSGFARYLAAGLRSLPKFRRNALRLSLDRGRRVEGLFQLVAIANGPQYGFDFGIAPQAKLDDGLLDVVCLRSVGPVDFLRNFVRAFQKRPLIGADYHRARTVKVEGPSMPCHLDGEPGPWTPLKISVRPRALRVLTPA